MDTYQIPETTVSSAVSPIRSDWAASMPILFIVMAAWTAMLAWSVNFVAHSVLAAGLVQAEFWAVLAFATGLQTSVGLSSLFIPRLLRPFRPVALVLCVTTCTGVLLFESTNLVFRALQTAAGEGFVHQEQVAIANLQQAITNLSQQIPALYQAKLTTFSRLANDALQGRDRTKIAICGPICQGRFDQYDKASAQFNHLAINTVPPAVNGSDVRYQMVDARHRLDSVKAEVGSLVDFYRVLDNTAPPRTITDAVTSLEGTLVAKEQQFSGIALVDSKNVALVNTFEAFRQMFRGTLPREDTLLPLGMGLLPALVLTALGIYLGLVLDARRRPVLPSIRQELAEEQEASSLLSQLVELKQRNWLNRYRVQLRRWK